MEVPIHFYGHGDLSEFHTSCDSTQGFGKVVVSKSVVLADVPLYQHFLKKTLPCSATLAEGAMIFEMPGPPTTEQGHIR